MQCFTNLKSLPSQFKIKFQHAEFKKKPEEVYKHIIKTRNGNNTDTNIQQLVLAFINLQLVIGYLCFWEDATHLTEVEENHLHFAQ